MLRIFLFSAAVAAILSTVSGCANAIRTYDDTEDRIERTVIGTKNTVRFTPEVPENSEFTVTVLRVNKQKVKKYQVFIHGDVVTPYEGWRQCYEMPCGLLLVPVSLCSHLVSVFTFGVYPFSVSNNITDLAYSGLNPCLNWESEERSEKHPLEFKEKLVDESEEDQESPIPNAVLTIVSGGERRKFTADQFGVVKLSLVGLSHEESIFKGDRVFEFFVGDDPQPVRQWLISRRFANQLLRARATILRYESSPSGRSLVQAVKALEGLKFTVLAYQLEKRELTKHAKDTAFIEEFNRLSLE